MIPFLDYLKELFVETQTEDPFLKRLKEEAWVRCSLPDKKWEAFNYLPLTDLYTQEYARAVAYVDEIDVADNLAPESQGYVVVFVNGHYHPSLSHLPPQLVVSTLPEAFSSYGQFLKHRLTQMVEKEKDPFALVNSALQMRGSFIYAPPKFALSHPLQILHLQTGSCFPRTLLFLGAMAELKVITTTVALSDEPFWSSSLLDLALEEGASFDAVETIDLSPENWCFQALRATLKKNSSCRILSTTRGSKTVRQDYRVSLLGENASVDLQGLNLLADKNQAHTHVLMEHLAPHCHSHQTFKNVLKDRSQASFQGKIYVAQKAQKTAAYQANNNLVVGPRAIANSKPNLEIFADDVKASHGATVGQLDAAALFYLRTRGLTESAARDFLVSGFCQEILDKIPYSSVREKAFR